MKKFILSTVIIAFAISCLITSCSQDDDWGMDEYSTLAGRRMTRSGENTQMGNPYSVIKEEDVPDSAIIFKNRTIDCFGYIKGVQYRGVVTLSGFVIKDTATQIYHWGLTKVNCSAAYIGNIIVNISSIDSVSCHIHTSFTASEGCAAGIDFVGQKDIRFNSYYQ